MKERPLLFKKEMVLATLEDKKNQTRRTRSLEIINQNPNDYKLKDLLLEKPKKDLVTVARFVRQSTNELICIPCPYGQPGDRLYVRETWGCISAIYDGQKTIDIEPRFIYKADGDYSPAGKWNPSIHMPKNASRIWLEITDIRVERLQDISEEDAIAEGIQQMKSGYWTGGLHKIKETPKHLPSPVKGFRDLWESIHGVEGWELNPCCWVVEFKKVEQNGN